MFLREMNTWFWGAFRFMLETRRENPPSPPWRQCFSSSSSFFVCSPTSCLFLFPLFPYTHLFSLPIPFFLFHVKPSLSKLFVSVPFCLFSKPKTLHAKARGGRGRCGAQWHRGEGAFVRFFEKCNLCWRTRTRVTKQSTGTKGTNLNLVSCFEFFYVALYMVCVCVKHVCNPSWGF